MKSVLVSVSCFVSLICSICCLTVPQDIFDVVQPYVITFKSGVGFDERDSHLQGLSGIKDSFSLGDDFSGYFGKFSALQVEQLRNNPLVELVEKDQIGEFTEATTQLNATWALSSISHRNLTSEFEYIYDSDGGDGVTVYVVDSGVKIEHEEFEGRAEWITAVTYPHFHIDYIGHGTHVAGIIGSKTFGVAKKVKIKVIGVAVGISVSVSSLIKGIEVAVRDHIGCKKSKKFKGAVMNLSIGFYASEAIDRAIEAASKAGIHIAVAAGNSDVDACEFSPARSSSPLCVGAIDVTNARANFSNWGPCVDLFAPGYDIESTFITTKTYNMAGTSMSSPHVAGLLAYYLSLYPERDSEFAVDVTPETLKERVLSYATKGVITDLDETTSNRLAYNGGGKSVW